MTEAEIEKLINDIYLGVVHVEHLPMELYLYYSNYLLGGLYQGYGTTLTDLIKSMNNLNLDLISDYEKGVRAHTLGNLSENIYHFSAAKTFQQVYDLQQGLIVDGFKVSFSDYKKYATTIVDQYNKNWLKVEYNTTIMSAMAASEWQTVYNQRSQFPLLQYQTVRDGRVRPDHARLDNIVRPVNDAFWNSFYPPNGWQCRCIVVQLEKGAAEITQLSATDKKEIKKDVPEVFRNNPGKSGRIFADHHPYFNVPERYVELKKNNFNLPLPKTKIEKPIIEKIAPKVTTTIEQFQPAKDLNEVVDRLIKTGIKEVSIKGLQLNEANAVLKAVEREYKIGNLNLNKLSTHRRPTSKAGAWYEATQNHISINLAHTSTVDNFVYKPMESWAEKLAKFEERLGEWKARLNDPKFANYSYDIRYSIRQLEGEIEKIKNSIANGEEVRPWTISSIAKSSFDKMEATMTHELGHCRHFKNTGIKTNFSFVPSKSVSNYGAVNYKEYYAEWFTHYRINGKVGVPADLLELFEKL